MSSQQSSQEQTLQRINVGLVPIISYEELEDATNFFNPSQVVGEGGYGIVYRGKLRDGRTVAVKDLHVRHPRRIEQFLNEVTVLSRIRHQNLVSLYGFTNPQTRKLLLVYEFVANGSLAHHLHGGRVTKGSLSWDTRIRIAVEAAEALSYLHSLQPPVIHRDIKTDNILLDNNFTVKVADLGSCRLLPWDVAHVSTMPQGTQGYLDPEYHQCLKLTDKSDVYSFGVVLLELISGKKALDLARDDEERWLSRMALNKMKNKEMEKLVDPALGDFSDLKMMWMVDKVTELALKCLKPKGNMRPPMMEVLTTLKRIRDRKILVDDDASSAPLAGSDDSSSASRDVKIMGDDDASSAPLALDDSSPASRDVKIMGHDDASSAPLSCSDDSLSASRDVKIMGDDDASSAPLAWSDDSLSTASSVDMEEWIQLTTQ